jgi:tetratricopeptide (TPR) repeat protein
MGFLDALTKRPQRKRLSELLVEAGIVKAEELPKGLEYAQKATDADVQAVQLAKELITEQGLSVPTALRALTLAKQKHSTLDQALVELGWRPRRPDGFPGAKPADLPSDEANQGSTQRLIKSSFNPEELDAIGGKPGPTYATDLQRNTWTGLKTRASKEYDIANNFLKGETTEPPAAPYSVPQDLQFAQPEQFAQAGMEVAQMQPVPSANDRETDQDWGLRDDHLQPSDSQAQTSTTMSPDGESGGWERTGEMEAYTPDFVNMMRAGDNHFSHHQYQEAEQQYLQALSHLERFPANRDLDIAELLVKMGRATLQISEFGRAEGYLCRALKIREITLGRDDIQVAECLDYLAELYDLQSQYLEAEHFYLGALGIKERVLNPDNSEVARSLKKLVAVSKRKGLSQSEEKKSGELLMEAGLVHPERIQEGLSIATQRMVPIGRALISLNYLSEQDLEAVLQAQLLLREGIIPGYLAVRALRLASQQRIGLERALREIGLEPDDQNFQGVFALLRAASELLSAERQLAPEDPGLAQLCVKVGDVYTDHHQYPQAESLYTRALSIKDRQPDADHREKAEIMARIADLQFRQQRYEEAHKLYVELLDLWEATVGADDINFVNCLESLAAVEYVRGDFKESGRLYQLAVTGKEKLLGKEHPAVASAIQGRANCYYGTQRYPEAEQLYRRAMQMYEKVYGANNEQVGTLLNVLGDLFYTQGDYQKALIEYGKGLNIFSKCSNPDIWAFTSMLEKSAHCFAEVGDLERADAYYRHFITTREGFGTFHTADMPDILERYAEVLDRLNRPQEAEAMRQHADSTRQFCNAQ